MLVNRVGDLTLLLAIFLMYCIFNTLDYDIVFTLVPLFVDFKIIVGVLQFPVIDIICIYYSLVVWVNQLKLVCIVGYLMLWKDLHLFRL